MWMGLRDKSTAAAVIVATGVCGAFALWLSRRRDVELRHGFVLLTLSSLVIGLMSAVFGPFILVPGQAATNTMYFAMSADRRGRRVVILAGVLAVVAPFALELLGIVPRSTFFVDGQIHILPRATQLPELEASVFLLLTSVAMVVIPGLMIGRMRDALAAAEQRLVLQAWNLRQLVPTEARGALGKSPSLMRIEGPKDT
jgi:serine/threonine-protein kinase